jgi:leucyl aminopeptidase
MQTELVLKPLAEIEADALVAIVLDREPKLGGALASLDKSTGGIVQELSAAGEVTGRAFETAQVFRPAGLKAKRLLLIGGGKPSSDGTAPSRPGIYELRKLAGAAARLLKAKGVRRLVIVAPPELRPEQAVLAISTGVCAANFEPGKYKSERHEDRSIDSLGIAFSELQQTSPTLEQAVKTATAIGEAQTFARELINEPSNRLTPTMLGQRAQAMAREAGLECELIDEKRARELKMGAFLSVAQGSSEPPVMIVLRYRGGQAQPGRPVLGLIGKGVTFDTGGISIKPADGMEKMKYDMAGGATMIGVMRAIALLKPKVKVIGIVCATENMPSGKAQKPGDIQTSMSGKTIEIINTDAEGRLVLADGLAYARQLGCTHLIDAATLTGAVVVALGYANAGVFASDDNMYQKFATAVTEAGEKMWRLPLGDEYLEMKRSSIADLQNTGGRWGGASTAAAFLKEFAEDTPWIHLDIAGTAWMEDNKPWIAKGPSGIAVRSLIEFAREFGS